MPNWKKVVTSGSNADLNTLNVTSTGAFGGSLTVTNSSGDTLTLTKDTTEPSLRMEGDTDKDFVLNIEGEVFNISQNDGATDIFSLDHDTKNATFGGDVSIKDLKKIKFGTDEDLEIYHDGGNSVIKDNGTGDLYLMGSTSIRLTNPDASEHYAKFFENGSVELMYDNVRKFQTTSPGAEVTGSLIVVGNTTIGDGGTGAALSFNSTNRGTFIVNSAEIMRLEAGGNVGIGTTSPAAKLEISGGSLPSGGLTNLGISTGLTTGRSGTYEANTLTTLNVRGDTASYELLAGSTSTKYSGIAATAADASSFSGTLQLFTAGEAQLFIDASGNIGVGTSAPSNFYSNARNIVVRGSDNTGITISSGATSSGRLVFNDGVDQNVEGEIKYDHSNESMAFTANSSEAMRIINGNLGVGIESPDSRIHSEITAAALNTTNLDDNTVVGLSVTIPDATLSGGEGVALALGMNGRGRSYIATNFPSANKDACDTVFYNESGGTISEQLRITQEGALQISGGVVGYLNTNTNQFEFDINRDPNDGSFNSASQSHARILMDGATGGSSIRFSTAATDNTIASERMRIDKDGNVGLGTTSPSTHLHVYQDDTSTNEILLENAGTGDVAMTFRSDDNTDGSNFASIYFDANDEGNSNTRYAKIRAFTEDNAAGAEDGKLVFTTLVGNSDTNHLIFDSAGSTFDSNITLSGTNDITVGGTIYGNNLQARTSAGLKVGNDDFSGFIQVADNGQVNLDSGNGEIHLKGSSSTFGKFFTSGDNFFINHPTADTKIIFSGTSGSSSTIGLTLDMADESATFKRKIQIGESLADDPTILFQTDSQSITMGIDRSDSNTFKISDNTSLAAPDRLAISTAGVITFNSAYAFPTSDGSANQILQTDGAGNLSFVTAGGGTVDGTGTANDVAMWSDSNTLTDAPIAVSSNDVTFAGEITSSNDVLIGAHGASGDKKLNILTGGGNSVINLMEAGVVYGFSQVYDGSTNQFFIKRHSNSAAGSAVLTFNRDSDNVAFAGPIQINSDGSDDNGASLSLKHANNNVTDTIGTIFFGNNVDDSLSSISVGTSGLNNSSHLIFSNSSNGTLAEHMRITSDGNIGIGTTSPSAKLHVQGSTLSDTLSTSNSATFGGDARLQSDLSTLNKAQSAYIDLATRDTSGSEVVYNLENIGSASFAGDITAVFDSNNSGNRLRIADTEGVSAAVRTYSTSDGTGLILNHYFAVAGSPYMRYSDFVSNMDDEAATTMRFLTKPHSGNPTVALTIDNSQDATFSGDVIVTGTNGLKIGTTSDLQSSSEIFSLEGGLAVMRNSSDSAATLYVQNHSTTADTIQPYIYFTDTGGNRGGIGIEYTTAKVTLNGQGGLRLTTGTSGVSGTEALVIDTNQKVGIGTFPQYNLTGPSAALHVVKDSGTSVTAVARFREINQTSKTTRIQLEDRSGSISDGIIDLVVPNETADNSYLGIGCNDSTQLVLANGGNVGIGTTSPDSKLEVITTSTNSAIELDNSDTDYTFIQYNAQGVTKGFAGFNSSYMMFGGESGTDTSLQAGGQIALTVKNDTQNVGIGTTSPNFKLDIVNAAASTATYQQFRNGTTGTASSDGTVLGIDADGDFLINNQEAKEIKLYTSDTQRLTIDSTGSVGIGISAPTQKLDVRGGSGAGTHTHAIFTGTNSRGLELRTRSDIVGGQHSGCAEINSADSENDGGELAFSSNGNVRMFIKGGGNVAVGQTDPDGKFQVRTTSSTPTKMFETGSYGIILEGSDTGTNGEGVGIHLTGKITNGSPLRGVSLVSEIQTTANDHDFIIATSDNSSIPAERMRVTGDGKVGIGTNNPDTVLTVAGSGDGGTNPSSISANTVATFRRTGGVSHNANISILGGTTGASMLMFGDRDDEDVGTIIYDHATDAMRFETNTSEKMRIASDGKVGIGTSSPYVPLQISTATSTTDIGSDGSYILALTNTDTTNNNYALISFLDGGGAAGGIGLQFTDHTNNYGDLVFNTRGADGLTERLRIDEDGKVGIGTNNPSYDLQIGTYGTDADSTLALASATDGTGAIRFGDGSSGTEANSGRITYNHSSNSMIFDTNGATEAMRIDSSQNIGIGTSSPTSDAIVKFVEIEDSTSAGIVMDAPRVYSIFSSVSSTLAFRDETAGTTRMVMDSGGNLGLGTTTPLAVLDIVSGSNNNEGAGATDFRFIAGNRALTSERANMELYTNDSQAADVGAGIGFGGRHTDASTNDSLFATIKSGKTNATSADYGGYVSFGTSRTDSEIIEHMRITSSGSVGIGTTAPDTPLHVQSTSATTANIMANGDYGLIVNCAGDGTDGEGTGIYLSGLRSDTNVTRGVALIAERNTSGNAHDFIIGTNAGASTPTEKMRITSAGDVGIGTSSPTSILELSKSDKTNGAVLSITNAYAGSDWAVNDAVGTINFRTDDTSTTEPIRSQIKVLSESGTTFPSGISMIFSTANGNTLAERLKISSAGALTFNQAYTFPTADGSANQVLQTDGAGNLSFAAASGGSTTINNNADNRVITGDGTANTLNGESNFTFDGTNMVIGEDSSDYTATIFGNSGNLVLRSQSGGTRAPSLDFNIAGTNLYQIVANNNTGGIAANTLTIDLLGTPKFFFFSDGDLSITGDLAKAGGSFKIDHPLESKKDTHHLVHSFIEGPKADLIYRGKVDLVDGTAQVNIDTVSNMTEGTFVALNTDVQCFTTNESNWDLVKGSVSGNILTIESQNTSSTASVSWMVIGERKDPHMLTSKMTDDEGKVIVEPEKENV